jgi:hypothetical protein
MDIPLDLVRRFERRWRARFSSPVVSATHQTHRLKGCVNHLPRAKAAGLCPPARTGEATRPPSPQPSAHEMEIPV